jgi:nitrite reductase (NADH) large subunit
VEKRKVLFERFVLSQKFAQVDPWAERVAGHEAYEFAPLAQLALPMAAE